MKTLEKLVGQNGPANWQDGRVTVILQGRRADMEYLRVEYSWPKTAGIFGQQSWKGHAV
jgi:hypothetical protein